MKETICIYHSRDLDGWMSAAIVKKWFKDAYPTNSIVSNVGDICSLFIMDFTTDKEFQRLYFLGWDYGDPIPDLLEYDRVIMCDISFPKEEMLKLYDRLEDDFIWIDHHISAILQFIGSDQLLDGHYDDTCYIEGERDTKYAACELTWKYFFPNEEMPEIVRLLGRYDCFGHKGTKEEQAVLEFQYGARSLIFNYNDAYNALNDSIQYHKFNHSLEFTSPEEDIMIEGEHIYKYLCNEAKQTYKKAFPIYLLDIHKSGDYRKNLRRKFLCVNQERFNPVNFGINYHKDGYDGFACFWYIPGKTIPDNTKQMGLQTGQFKLSEVIKGRTNGKWMFSLYNDNGEVDCSQIAKSYGGGGHKGASGFIIDNINGLNKIIHGE